MGPLKVVAGDTMPCEGLKVLSFSSFEPLIDETFILG